METRCIHCGNTHPDTLKFCPTTGRLISPERLYPPGTLLEGKYRLNRAIGVGGMGAVFDATHVLLDRRVAIKVLLPEYAKDQEMCARLIREARAASATGHPSIVAVHDMGHADDGTLFVVMEYVVGRTLKRLIAEEAPLEVSRAVRFVDQVLSALEVVHRKGVVHRDLKPANLLVVIDDQGEERLRILDFGISKITGDERVSSLTTVGKVMGTPRYMSPEQAVGDSTVDGRADVYACGVILYELLTGRTPFSAASFNEMIALLLHGDVQAPSELVPGLPRELDALVLHALARAREERIPEPAAFRRRLRPFLADGVGETKHGVGPDRPAATVPPAQFAMEPISFVGVDQEQLLEQAAPPTERTGAAESVGPGPESPGTPELDAPGEQEDAPLELAGPARPDPAASAPAAAEQVYRPPAGSGFGWLRWVAVLTVVVAVAGLLWHYRRDIQAAVTGTPAEPDAVLLLVETEPREATVYVDGVRAVSSPIQLPRTERSYTIRVEAPGYLPQELEVSGVRTRTVRVSLKRRRRR